MKKENLFFLIILIIFGCNVNTNIITSNNVNNDSNALVDRQCVDKDSENLTLSSITFAEGDSASYVTQNFTVPVSGENGTVISWSCLNIIVDIDKDGNAKVTRPSYGSGNFNMVCEAKISKGDEVKTKEFRFTIIDLPVTTISVSGISLNKLNITIVEGNTEQLSYTITPDNATNKSVTWYSSNSTIATINETGLITAISVGSTTIKAVTTDGSFEANCNIIVTASSVASWDNSTEPKIISSSPGSLTFSWIKLTSADHYNLYKVNSWGPPIDETLLDTTTNNTITDTTSVDKDYRLCAMDGSDIVIDCRHIKGWYSSFVPNTITGYFSDDFEDGILNSNYFFSKSGSKGTFDISQVTEANGYLQLNGNQTDNFPYLWIKYDSLGKRYIKVSLKDYSYKVNTYFINHFDIISFDNNRDSFEIRMQSYSYSDYNQGYGSVFFYYNYPNEQDNDHTTTLETLSSVELFDQWVLKSMVLDIQTGDITININGTIYTKTVSIDYSSGKIILSFIPGAWGTGQYIRIDDLQIESSDTPF